MDVYGNINVHNNEISQIIIETGSVFPSSPAPIQGRLFYLTQNITDFDKGLYCYNGTTWISGDITKIITAAGSGLTGGGSSGEITISLDSTTQNSLSSFSTHLSDASVHLTSAQNTLLDAVTVSATEINYLSGITSSIQTQLDGKQSDVGFTANNGSVALGTLAPWASSITVLQVKNGTVYSVGSAGSYTTSLINNAYYDGSSFKYLNDGTASMLSLSSNTLSLYQAVSGTVDTPISFTTALTVDSNGLLSINPSVNKSGTKEVRVLSQVGNTCGYRLFQQTVVEAWIATLANDAALTIGFSVNYTNPVLKISQSKVTIVSATGFGYDTGSGGAVTQATSKSTGVTLNKPTGQITMNNAALSNGASVSFTVTNSFISSTDTVIVNGGSSLASSYRLEVAYVTSGSFEVRVTNITGGSLSEAVVINFSILKGASA